MDLRYIEAVLADKPVAYWPLMETEGALAYDWSGHGYYGAIQGGVTLGQPTAPGLPGTAMTFEGNGGYIATSGDYPEIPAIQYGSMSLELWGNIPTDPSTFGFMAGFRDSLNGEFYILQLDGTNTLETRFTNSGGDHQDFDGQPDIPTWTPNVWHHGVLVYNEPAQTLTFYTDGNAVATRTATGTITITPIPFWIGSQAGDNPFAGSLAHIALYNGALTPLQIQRHFFARPRDLMT